MTYVDMGTTGAKRASWRDCNPRALLRDIIQSNPAADEGRWRQQFLESVQDDLDLMRAIIEYWLDNNIRSLTMLKLPDADAKDKILKATQAAKVALKRRIEREAKVILLGLAMPNGKPLSKCTGADCRSFGGWFQALGRRVPARKTVGEVLTEDQVARIWERHRVG